jgi:hypothetical protein
MTQLFSSVESSQRNLRVVLFIIILATLPFYCLGFILWGAAPAPSAARGTSTPTQTLPPVTQALTNTPSATAGFGPLATVTSFSPLQPTPRQFLPPGGVNPVVPLPPTSTQIPVVFPTATSAPTLTPIPSFTPIPQATATTVEIFPTSTTIPFEDGDSGGSDSGGEGGEENFMPEPPTEGGGDVPADTGSIDSGFPTPTQESLEP